MTDIYDRRLERVQMNDFDGVQISRQVKIFRDFLKNSWSSMCDAIDCHNQLEDDNFIRDWIQTNWEFLVEREVTMNIGIISSLFIDPSKRCTKADRKHEYIITTTQKRSLKIVDLCSNKEIDFSQKMRLYGFCSETDSGFKLRPPFDLCNLRVDETDTNYVAPLKGLMFYIQKVPR